MSMPRRQEDHFLLERIAGTEHTYDVQREWREDAPGKPDWVWEARVVLDFPIRVTRGAISTGMSDHIAKFQSDILSVKYYEFRGVL
jgi:hypothetical protein